VNTREIARLIKKMRLQDGDVLFITEGSSMAKKEIIQSIADYFDQHSNRRANILVVVIDDLNNVSKLDKNEMHRHGWYRKEDLMGLIGGRHGIPIQVRKVAKEEDVIDEQNE